MSIDSRSVAAAGVALLACLMLVTAPARAQDPTPTPAPCPQTPDALPTPEPGQPADVVAEQVHALRGDVVQACRAARDDAEAGRALARAQTDRVVAQHEADRDLLRDRIPAPTPTPTATPTPEPTDVEPVVDALEDGQAQAGQQHEELVYVVLLIAGLCTVLIAIPAARRVWMP